MADKPYYEYIGEAYNDPERMKAALPDIEDLDEAAAVMAELDDKGLPTIVDPVKNQAYDTSSPLDWMGDMAMGPIISKWGNGVKRGERMGKSAKNVEKTLADLKKAEEEGPKKIMFHRTKKEYAPSINETGLKAKSPNQGENTNDQSSFPDVIWMADNPDNISVLNSKIGGFSVRNNPDVTTFKMEMPLDKYNNMKRYKLDDSKWERQAIPVKPGESAASKDYTRKTGGVNVELVGEDIDPKYLTEMQQIPEDELKEAQRFVEWLENGGIHELVDAAYIDRKMPKSLLKDIQAITNARAIDSRTLSQRIPEIRRVMKEFPKFRSGNELPPTIDWEEYNKLVKEEGVTPLQATQMSFVEGKNPKAPWNAFDNPYNIGFNNGSIGRGTEHDYFDNLRMKANADDVGEATALQEMYDITGDQNYLNEADRLYDGLKNRIQNDNGSAYRTYKFILDNNQGEDYVQLLKDYGASDAVAELMEKIYRRKY